MGHIEIKINIAGLVRLAILFTLILVAAKVFNLMNISWWWAVSPVLLLVAMLLVVALVVYFVVSPSSNRY